MKFLTRARSYLRRALGAPFRLEKRDNAPGVTFELVMNHQPRLRSPIIAGHDSAMVELRAKQWDLRDFVATIRGPVLLDTGLGWVVRGRDLLEVGNWSMVAQSPALTKPSILRWAQAAIGAEDVDRAVWLPFGAGNYFHFLNDMVAGLALLAERRDLTGCAVLVSEELAAKAFFKEVVGLSSMLSGLAWQTYGHDRWLRAGEVHVAGTSFGSYATFCRAIALLDRLPPVKARPERRMFVTRRAHTPRTPTNINALEQTLRDRGFEVVDFDGMSFLAQRELINSASTIVAIHGAGLANLAFHEAPTKVKLFEITPADFLNPCFAFMAEEAGMGYFCFAGGPRDPQRDDRFDVPLDSLLDAIDRFLAR